MTNDPDVTPVGFAATDGPDARLHRRRNPAWLVLAILLASAGAAGIVWFVWAQLENAPGRDEAVAGGRVAALRGADTPVVRFSGEGAYTVWLDLDGVTLSNNRELIVAATNCAAGFENGRSARFRGARQGANVTVGDRSTIGTFTAPRGEVALSCRQLPFGRRGRRRVLDAERSFFVTSGSPGVGWAPWVAMFGGIALSALAFPVFGRYSSGSLRRR